MKHKHRRFSRIRARAARAGRSFASGGKGTLVSALGGAVCAVVHKVAADNIEFVGKHALVAPIAFGVAGHLAKKKFPNLGAGIVGVAGYKLGEAGMLMVGMGTIKAPETGAVYDDETGAMYGGGASIPALSGGMP